MRRLRLIVSLLILLSVFSAHCSANSKDVFILIDVSGTMNNNSVNQEAKQIIREYLLGKSSLESWNNIGWTKDSNWDSSIPSSIVDNGSRACLIPFGNINRVQDRRKYTVSDLDEFSSWFNSSFPSRFNDSWTYLTLAHAYVGSVALTENISKAFVIVYTDGMPESTKQQYNEADQRRVDEYQHANAMRKLGILRKNVGNKHYDIEIWDFTLNSEIKTDEGGQITDGLGPDKPQPPIDKKSFRITNPKNEGLNEKHSLSVKQEEPFCIGWNESGASVIISQKKDGSWRKINGNDIRNYYSISKQANSAKITFLESGDYKIMVRGEHGSDERYVSVSSDFLKLLLPILLILLAVVGAVFAYQKFFKKPDSWDDNDGGHKSKNSMNNTSSNDDW